MRNGLTGHQARVCLVLKTSQRGHFTLPHIEALRSRGHEVIAVLPAKDGAFREDLVERGVTVVDSPFNFRFRPTYNTLVELLRFRRKLREIAPDVLHYHLYHSALAARIASVGLSIPRVHMVAGPLYLESPLIRFVERWLTRFDTVTIGGSEFTARWYRELGRPAETTPAIPYGVDIKQFQPQDGSVNKEVRAELEIEPDDFVAVMVAFTYAPKRLVHPGHGIKGHDVLLKAWRQFHARHPDSRLILIGGGFGDAGERHRQELMARFQLDAQDGGVTWLDTVPDVRRYYAAADVSISPSRSESHGAAREASAMGVPSIVSDAGGLPETVNRQSGWVVPRGDCGALADALDEAYAEHAEGGLALRGHQARQLALLRFDNTQVASAVADVIERTVFASSAASDAASRVFSVFTEARLSRRAEGGYAAFDPAIANHAWHRYTGQQNEVRLVARASQLASAESFALPDYVKVEPLPYYVGVRGLVRRLPSVIRAVWCAVANSDTIVLRGPGAISSIAGVVCRLLRRNYMVEVIGDPVDVLRSGALGAAGRLLSGPARWHMRWLVRRASASVFVTHRSLQQRYPPREGTSSIGVSNVRLEPGALLTHGRSWNPGPYCIAAIGSQATLYKGHDVLLHAVRQLIDEGIDVTATIVGGGRAHDELVKVADMLGIADRVVFTGVIHERARIIDILDSSSLFVQPSRTEGLPRSLVEAMARALPCVGSDVGGIPELLDQSCLVPVEDASGLAGAIRRLLSDPERWEGQSDRNLKVAREYEASLLETRFATFLAHVPTSRRPRKKVDPR